MVIIFNPNYHRTFPALYRPRGARYLHPGASCYVCIFRYLLTGGLDGCVRLWDMRMCKADEPVRKLTICPAEGLEYFGVQDAGSRQIFCAPSSLSLPSEWVHYCCCCASSNCGAVLSVCGLNFMPPPPQLAQV